MNNTFKVFRTSLFLILVCAAFVLMLKLQRVVECPILGGFLGIVSFLQFVPFDPRKTNLRIFQMSAFVMLLLTGVGILTGITAGIDNNVRTDLGIGIICFAVLYGIGMTLIFLDRYLSSFLRILGLFMGLAAVSGALLFEAHSLDKIQQSITAKFAKENPEWVVVNKDLSEKYRNKVFEKYKLYNTFEEINIDSRGVLSHQTQDTFDNLYFGFTISPSGTPPMLSYYAIDTAGQMKEQITFRYEEGVGCFKYQYTDRTGKELVRDTAEILERFNFLLSKSDEIARN